MFEKRKLDFKEISKEAEEQFERGNELQKLGEKFLEDKKKINEQIEKIEDLPISFEDKKEVLSKLIDSLKVLEKQYENDVIKEQEKKKEKMDEQVKEIEETEKELEEQDDSLGSISLERATDVSFDEAESEIQKNIEKLKELRELILETEKEQQNDQEDQSAKIRKTL